MFKIQPNVYSNNFNFTVCEYLYFFVWWVLISVFFFLNTYIFSHCVSYLFPVLNCCSKCFHFFCFANQNCKYERLKICIVIFCFSFLYFFVILRLGCSHNRMLTCFCIVIVAAFYFCYFLLVFIV